jgi:hypothetical protein
MITTTAFFDSLQEEEYLNCFMTNEVYNGIDFELREQIAVNEVRKKNKSFEDDEEHKNLVTAVSKAKKKLRNYEYDQNHKK